MPVLRLRYRRERSLPHRVLHPEGRRPAVAPRFRQVGRASFIRPSLLKVFAVSDSRGCPGTWSRPMGGVPCHGPGP
ncbi:hypothetical protein KCH_71560 [Kitasatospora cheerisanensis KCTC 2395]|uniref:Uncharacterized protein n=1 Tax=Kitasatospora cheerisanensis KCTC 2395 TaxID=1348663 RepID=A0A066YIT2_9ACTN|nr:hypothetical protein KCH_71560 [Kitasatospora cheerisanensis KCTC 2395]